MFAKSNLINCANPNKLKEYKAAQWMFRPLAPVLESRYCSGDKHKATLSIAQGLQWKIKRN
ncbi:MAG TPA: hypothetical protein VMY77_17200 [Chitinophagaceae bacterium]|nr:hypothetical protein [Chitinophagaceae bacterium]